MTAGDKITKMRTERIPDNPAISDADAAALIDFSDELYLLKTTYSDHRHEKLLRHCLLIAENVGGLADALEDRTASEEIVRWINREYDNEETNRDYRVALRVFGRRLTPGEEPPDSIDWIPSGTSTNYDPRPDPREMLHWDEHILPMIEATHNNRDAAMIAVAWDTGVRSGEFRSLQVGDVTDHAHGLQLTVDGKTGQRSVMCIPSVPYLQRWLQDHPAREDGDAPLWSKLHSPAGLSFKMFQKAFRSAADRAEVDRPVNLTNFRKSSASYLASKGMNQAHIEDHHGWVRGSRVASRYVAVFAGEAENALAKIHGLDVADEEDEPVGPVECPRCDKQTPRDKEFCVWCEQALDQEAVQQLKTDERRVQRAILRMVSGDASLLERAEDRERVVDMLEDDPELQARARRFLDELAG